MFTHVFLTLAASLMSGHIPTELGSLTAMTHGIFLDFNRLTGFCLTSLQLFCLSPASLLPVLCGFHPINETVYLPGTMDISPSTDTFAFPLPRYARRPIPSELGRLSNMKDDMVKVFPDLTYAHTHIFKAQANARACLLPQHLNNNDLTGSIPSELGRLTAMSNWFYIYEYIHSHAHSYRCCSRHSHTLSK